jgi:hypothetical protein
MSVLLSQTDGRDDLDAQAIALARAEEQLQVRAFDSNIDASRGVIVHV